MYKIFIKSLLCVVFKDFMEIRTFSLPLLLSLIETVTTPTIKEGEQYIQVWMHEMSEISVQLTQLIHQPVGASYVCKGTSSYNLREEKCRNQFHAIFSKSCQKLCLVGTVNIR